jgi:hypothetical protein
MQAAEDGDYPLKDFTDEELAFDLLAYAEDIVHEKFEDVLWAVREIRREALQTLHPQK